MGKATSLAKKHQELHPKGGDGGDKGEAISVVITEGGSNANNAKAFVAAAQVDEIAGAEAD